ncbi:hypothetical protein LB504_012352 [Fusarium proliferatum]|nr:hypothetical protein LB504_012352 [Fusarium proliferatum]
MMLRRSLPVTHVHVQFKVFTPDTRIQDGEKILTQIQQDCLTSNGYNEAKCQTAIKRLYECCEAFYERYGEEASTVSCPKPNLLKLKMNQLREEAK